MTTTDNFDLLILGGEVIDGTRAPRFRADVGVRGGRIAAVGNLRGRRAARALDARGRVVAPGFIDSHTHDDQALVSQPDLPFKVSQGVTTVVTGNCGISVAPLRPDAPLPAPLNLLDEGQRRFETFEAYLDALHREPPAVNVVPLVGHTTLRVMAMDDVGRSAQPSEIETMQRLLREALDAGAFGLSTGTYYPPAAAATTEEVIAVARPLAAAGALYVTHMRDEADRSLEALEESFGIGKALGVPVLISHHKLKGESNFGKSRITLPRIARQMQCQCVALDCYPYTASSTMLHTDAARLQGQVRIASSEPHPEMQGRELGEVAALWGVSRVEAARRLQPASAVYFSMSEEDVRAILGFERTMIGSDGIPVGEQPHPRLWGTFPRVLGLYSRELGLFPLETAVWKMTGLTAEVFGLEQRGVVREGAHADLVVFDPATVRDGADYDNPTAPPKGIDAVIVNGVLAWREGAAAGPRAGQVLRRPRKPAIGFHGGAQR